MKTEAFKAWLMQQGAEVLANTNQYETVRFRARGGVHVVYWGKRGLSMGQFARECYDSFLRGAGVDMGLQGTQRESGAKYRHALFERDGRDCFYCLEPMTDDDASVEHLVSIHKGGPNHLDNMVLAHRACNARVGNLPLVTKIRVRERAISDSVSFGKEDANEVCRLLNIMTRLEQGSWPNALDKANALHLWREIRRKSQ